MKTIHYAGLILTSAIFVFGPLLMTAGCDDAGSDNSSLALLLGSEGKRIFMTSPSYSGNLGGVAGADSICQAEGEDLFPDETETVWKALLVGSGRSITTNWVLQPGTRYVRALNTRVYIGTTNDDAIFDFPVSNSIDGSGDTFWTGMEPNWAASDTCSSWTSSGSSSTDWGDTGSSSGIYGFYIGAYKCNIPSHLACVEQ